MWVIAKHFGNICFDSRVIAVTSGWEDIRDAADTAGSHKLFGFDEGNLTDAVKVEISEKVSGSFHFINREIGAKIIAERVGKIEKVGEGKILLKDFFFDANEDFLLRGAAREVAASGAVTGAGEA